MHADPNGPGKAELKKQFSRDHNGGDWTIREVMASILLNLSSGSRPYYSNSFSKELCTMKPPNFKGNFQGTYLINPGLQWYV